MMVPQSRSRRGVAWAVAGGAVLLAGVLAVVIVGLTSQPPSPDPTSTSSQATSTPRPTPTATDAAVDESVTERGWTPEPITRDAATYAAAALAAASTFDTQLSSRDEWLAYLDTWFTPDTRYTDPGEQVEAMEASQLELRQGVVLPEPDWESLAREGGRVIAVASEPVEIEPVPEDASGDMSTATADVTLTFARTDGSGGEITYDETVRVSVQVLCGDGSVPTAGSAQEAGDCKVIRYFSGTQEP